MKTIYMNHRIREKKPSGPVIVVQDEAGTTEANSFAITVGGEVIGFVEFDSKGCPQVTTHDVKAWVEFNDRVTLHASGKTVCTPAKAKPRASAKKPNRKVKT